MSDVQVTICIPTLNRPHYIGETLDSIIRQANEAVEIVVVDGGSNNETELVVQKRALHFKQIKYIKSAYKNVATGEKAHWSDGFEHDCDRAVEEAKGEYCWLLPDDDVLKEGAISRILDAIQQGHALIIVDAEVRTSDLAGVVETNRLQLNADRVYASMDQDSLLQDTGLYLSYIGGVVIRREIWISRRPYALRSTAFPHVAVIFQDFLPGSTLVIARPMIEIRYGNAQWYPRAFEIWMILWPQLIWSFEHISESTKQAITRRHPWRRTRKLIRLRALGAYSLHDYTRWISPSVGPFWQKWIALIIALLNIRLMNYSVLIYCLLFRRNSPLDFEDLRAGPANIFQSRSRKLQVKE